jgi:hypothetical protein
MRAADSDSQHYDRPRLRAAPSGETNSSQFGTTVNRPFSAFASLMALLALAMFAVSSTTRSTTVQPAAQPRSSEQSHNADLVIRQHLQNKQEMPHSRQFVVKPVEKEATEKSNTELKILANANIYSEHSIRPVSVVAAEQVKLDLRTRSTTDCLSHYDAFYDWTVYGVGKSVTTEPAERIERSMAESTDVTGELDSIFHELVSRQSTPPAQAGARKQPGKPIRWKAIVVATSAWAKYQLLGTAEGGMPPPIGWKEYADFDDHLVVAPGASSSGVTVSGSKLSVRSSDWLRHSAASSLYRMSVVLRSAAEELDGLHDPALAKLGE